ncbi:MAG: hypothetical protein AAFZ15_24980 [Bacteroidota bacterium]
MANRKTAQFKLDGFLGVLLLVGFFIAIFFILQGVMFVLRWVAPALLVAALIIDHKVVLDYGKWLMKTLKSNPLFGIGAILFTVLGYMLVFPYLFAKALFKRKMRDVRKGFENQRQGELIDYEEISSEPRKNETLELPRLEEMEKKQRNDYDNMFD